MNDLSNILDEEDELNEDMLKKYLEGTSSGEEAHLIEEQMAGSSFVSDAVEGLQAVSSQNKLDEYVHELNKKLHIQLEGKKQKNEKRRIKNMLWVIIAVIVILLLCVLAYMIIRMQREKEIELRQNTIKSQLYTPGNYGSNDFTL